MWDKLEEFVAVLSRHNASAIHKNRIVWALLNIVEAFRLDMMRVDDGEIKGVQVYIQGRNHNPPNFHIYDNKTEQLLAVIEIPKRLSDPLELLMGELNSSQESLLRAWLPKKTRRFKAFHKGEKSN